MLFRSSHSIYFKTRNEITSSKLQTSLHFTIALYVSIPLSVHSVIISINGSNTIKICLVTFINIPNTMYYTICAKVLCVFVKIKNNSTQSSTLTFKW